MWKQLSIPFNCITLFYVNTYLKMMRFTFIHFFLLLFVIAGFRIPKPPVIFPCFLFQRPQSSQLRLRYAQFCLRSLKPLSPTLCVPLDDGQTESGPGRFPRVPGKGVPLHPRFHLLATSGPYPAAQHTRAAREPMVAGEVPSPLQKVRRGRR